jgi:1-acyl-sn-glycerol-3-phosphate acyltransferase
MNQNRSLSQSFALLLLHTMGWKISLSFPLTSKYVLIGAPHTSNWDFFYFLLLKWASGIKMNWIGKESLFHWPLGIVMRRLGGIPVDRNSSNHFVQQIVALFGHNEQLAMTIAPEGTRSKARYWKTGFYYIALGARVPISLGFIDYLEREVGIGPFFYPSGNIQDDFDIVRHFYANKTGKHPELQGEVRLLAEVWDE